MGCFDSVDVSIQTGDQGVVQSQGHLPVGFTATPQHQLSQQQTPNAEDFTADTDLAAAQIGVENCPQCASSAGEGSAELLQPAAGTEALPLSLSCLGTLQPGAGIRGIPTSASSVSLGVLRAGAELWSLGS